MNKFEKTLLTVFFIEIFVGGGGRLIDFGVLSIRQVLFILLLLSFILRILKNRDFLNREINTFLRFNAITIGIYILLGWFGVSAIIGIMNGHALSDIITDLFRVTYFILYFPLAYYISEKRFSLEKIITILKYSALVVAIFTITVSFLGKTVFSNNFVPFYNFMNLIMNDDLFFRPSNSVFYKSHFFVLIGLIISLNSVLNKSYLKVDIANIILCSISALWSETRGFLIAFVVSILIIILTDIKIITDPIKGMVEKTKTLVHSRQFIKKFLILVVVIISVPVLYENMTLDRFEQETTTDSSYNDTKHSNRSSKHKTEVNDVSVNARMEFIVDSKRILFDQPSNLFIGTGYGTEIGGRVTGIEMSFLDILVEQGLVGLGIWLFLCLLVFYNFYYVHKRGSKLTNIEISILAAFMGILLLTNINPFINNPIGISFFLILLIISQQRKEQTKSKGR
ncbi:O-antigen ligase family protein [Bacillus sp. DJP31]|uniref:O-antigen ligase family protein n=1 Tax=Bacillus sp. DJP31 TaxID=3409789 RepID=UPI003BB705AE